ncbi:MAG: hypothetical protein HQK51_05550 [Oligoflexia bacterium]|nr:hypothetical protein [Oligoflexia bacterium]
MFYLWWEDRLSVRYPAGVSFFNSAYNEYRLKIDAFPNSRYFLRVITVQNGNTVFRLESFMKDDENNYINRRLIGKGFINPRNNNEIVINSFPFEKRIILVLKNFNKGEM